MVGTVDNEQPKIGAGGADSVGQERLEPPTPGSRTYCSSCGASIEHDAARCPWCGRVVLKDAVFGSESAARDTTALPRYADRPLIDVVLETRRDSTWL